MRVIIAGSRHIEIESYGHSNLLMASLASSLGGGAEAITEIIQGGCPTGPDSWAPHLAKYLDVPCRTFPADWTAHGRAAGPIRNAQMAQYASEGPSSGALILVWDGESKGSRSMKRNAALKGLQIVEMVIPNPKPEPKPEPQGTIPIPGFDP